MLLYGGIGLLVGGLIVFCFGDRFQKDAPKAAAAKKQAPILMVIGAIMIGLAFALAS